MKRSLFAIVLLALTVGAEAQQATLTVPVVRNSEHNYRCESYFATRDDGARWEATVSIRDSGGVEIRRVSFSGPDAAHPAATALALVTQQLTAVAGETGGNARRMDARVLQFLITHSYITGVTLAP